MTAKKIAFYVLALLLFPVACLVEGVRCTLRRFVG